MRPPRSILKGADMPPLSFPDDDIVRRFNEGESVLSLAKTFGVGRNAIYGCLKRAGVERRGIMGRVPRPIPPEDLANAIAAYIGGESALVAARQFRIPNERFAQELKGCGLWRNPKVGFALRGKKLSATKLKGAVLPDAEIVRRYGAGESAQALAKEFGVDRDAINTRLTWAGVEVRGPLASQRVFRTKIRRAEDASETMQRSCEGCGAPLVRAAHEPPSKWRNRKTCGHACFGAAQRIRSSATVSEKLCIVCGAMLVRREREKSSKWRRRKTCGRKCQIEGLVRITANLRNASSPNKIEQAVYEALALIDIQFSPQFRIGSYFVDALIPATNTVVEVQGDYWHCNPAVFLSGPINERQRIGVARDKRRFAYLRNRGYRIVELWEKDIRQRGALALLKEALGVAD